jgi:ATP-dependent Lon protease
LLLDEKVDKTVAMTGEISLRGDILKIGGLKEKIIAAYNNGIKKVFIPYENNVDVNEIPKMVRDEIKIIPVKNYLEVFNKLFKKEK